MEDDEIVNTIDWIERNLDPISNVISTLENKFDSTKSAVVSELIKIRGTHERTAEKLLSGQDSVARAHTALYEEFAQVRTDVAELKAATVSMTEALQKLVDQSAPIRPFSGPMH
jgi:hypothetical protein